MRIKILIVSIAIVLLSTVVVIFYVTVYPWVMIGLGIPLLPNPPKPEITYGEFPFRLEYEINGQRKVIKDTLICEYNGIGINEGQGKYRKWKERLASGGQDIILLKVNNAKTIYYSPGSADYYMDDLDEKVQYVHNFPDACYFEKYSDGSTSNGIISEDELLQSYHIKLVDWEYTQPIKNSFTKTNK